MAPSRPSSLADSASSGAGGTRPTAPAAASVIRPKEASAAAQATTRRSDDNAASSGTTTIHGTRKDVMLPVSQAVKVIRPAKFAAEIRCARLNLPVRDKKMAMANGDRNQRKATASSSVGPSVNQRYKGKMQIAISAASRCAA